MTEEIINTNGTEVKTPPAETPSWFIDEGVPGVGARPAWLSDKFKTAADLAKSYNELEKKVGVVPDEYDFSKSRHLDADYVPFEELRQLGKDKRVPQEVFDKMIDSVDKYLDEFAIDEAEEIAKLGADAKERVTTLENWTKANMSKESYEALSASLRTAEGIKALEELRGKVMSNNAVIPNGNENAASNTASLEDIKLELSNNLNKYKTDVAYRKDISARLEVAAKNNGSYIDKVGA